MDSSYALVGFDWTGPVFRAWTFSEVGDVLAATESQLPSVPWPADLVAETHARLASWLGGRPSAPVIGCGDIGSFPGAGAMAALTLPQPVAGLASHLVHEGGLHIVPWLRQMSPPDLSCGAEVVRIGIDEPNGAICIPGAQTRHVILEFGRITRLSTEITAGLRDLLLASGPLALPPGAAQVFDAGVFRDWVERALDTEDVPPVFSIRAAFLMGSLPAHHQAAALSGLLIGADVAAHYDPGDDVILAADGPLLEAYGIALDALGADVEECSATEALQDGLFELADLAGLLGD